MSMRLVSAVLVAVACAYAARSTADELQLAFMRAMQQLELKPVHSIQVPLTVADLPLKRAINSSRWFVTRTW